MNNISAKMGIGGEYVVKIIDKNGNERLPFGDKPNKNLILDTFFNSILQGYGFGIEAFMQSCSVGDSNTEANRTQTGLQGLTIETSHKGTIIYGGYDGTYINISRDFLFNTNNTESPITYREALVGCFGSNISGMDITTSRFVFPEDVVINPSEQLIIFYIFKIGIDYLNRNVPFSLSGDGIDLQGYLRMGASDTALGLTWSSDLAILAPDNGTNVLIAHFDQNHTTFYYRSIQSNNLTFNSVSTSTTSYRFEGSEFSNIFCLFFVGAQISRPDNMGFIPSSDTFSHNYTVYPNDYGSSTTQNIVGPKLQYIYRYNYQASDNGASIILRYFFPSHSSNRTVSGLRLYGNNANPWALSSSRIKTTNFYLKFTESDFSTIRNITIPAGKPVIFNLKWEFVRI